MIIIILMKKHGVVGIFRLKIICIVYYDVPVSRKEQIELE
jgi:hypothetical protein